MTTGAKNTILGSYNGNQGGLDIRTSNNYIVLSDGDGNPRQIIDNNGNLGLGTSSPSYKLDVIGASGSFAGIRVNASSFQNAGLIANRVNNGNTASLFFTESGANQAYITSYGSAYGSGLNGALQIVNNSNALTYDSSGNLGLGVTPSGWGSSWTAWQTKFAGFMGNKNDGGSYLLDNAYFDGTNFRYLAPGPRGAGYYSQYNGGHSWSISSTGTAGSAISFTQAMTLFSSGGLALGNTSDPGSTNLYVAGNVIGNGGSHTFSTATGSSTVTIQAQNASSANAYLTFLCPGSNSGQIWYERATSRLYAYSQSGGVYLAPTSTSWTSNSDERGKDIIEPIADAVNKVSTLRTVIGKYKNDKEGTRRSFLIAQDVQAVLPEAVDASNPDNLGVQYSDVIPLLVAAIKELKAEFDAYKSTHP
jgi:hypothetical protein